MTITLSALNAYPVKSCAGGARTTAEVGPRGIVGDREFLVVDATGRFLTQREYPRLALVRPDVAPRTLTLHAPSRPPITLPIVRDGVRRDVVVWDDICATVDQGQDVADWLSDYLGHASRLVRMADDVVRPVNPRYATRATDQVGFADGYPFLLISEESLAELNQRLAEPLPMNRFRPNLVIRGAEPFVEDRLRTFRIGEVVFRVVKPCARCVITTTDQATAVVGKEPLATLASFRKTGHKVLFGQNLIHHGAGTIRIGDEVEVIER